MKPLRLIVLSAVITLCAFVLIAYSSCKKDSDPCSGTCQNGGSCNSTTGACTCLAGFTGIHCETDVCATLVCANGGICSGGVCVCPAGYEGTQCETQARNKFVGTWVVFEKGSISLAATFNLSILPADTGSIQNIAFSNFYNYFTSDINAYVKGDTIIIPLQTSLGKTVSGTGYMTHDTHYAANTHALLYYKVTDIATNHVDDFGIDTADHSSPAMMDKN